jgi:hypothetical protein
MRRLRTAVATAAVLLIPTLAACGNSDKASQENVDPAAVIRKAAEQSGADSFSFTMAGTDSGEKFTLEGEYQGGANPALHMKSDDAPAEEGGAFESIQIGDDEYSKFADGGEMFPSGKWVRSDATDDQGSFDFRDYFTALLAAADVTDLGPTDVEGTSTRHYSASITVAELKAATVDEAIRKDLLEDLEQETDGTQDLEAWIDEDFQIRRFAIAGERKGGERDGGGVWDTTMTLRDFDKDFHITAPPAAEVIDSDSPDYMSPVAPSAAQPDDKCRKAMQKQLEKQMNSGGPSGSGDVTLPAACR